MKLLQLNAWGGRLEPQILQLLNAEKPDILCLQEAIEIKGGNGGLFVSVEEMQAALNAEHVYMSPVFTINHMSRKADFGNCIISRFPVKENQTIFTGREYVPNFDFLDSDANMRNLQHVIITLDNGTDLHILNHHGHHIHQHKNGDDETMKQCGMIADYVKKLSGKIILSGDFNLAPHSESLEQLNVLLKNLPLEAGLTTTRTVLTHKTEVCDYIFVNNDVKVLSFKASDEVVSDHKALVLEFS